jgi:hypothetical protein
MDLRRMRVQDGSNPLDSNPPKEEGAIVEFFGQLWLIPELSTNNYRKR